MPLFVPVSLSPSWGSLRPLSLRLLPFLLPHLHLSPHLKQRREEERGRAAFANPRVSFRESEGRIPRLLHLVWDCSERQSEGAGMVVRAGSLTGEEK